MIRRLWKSIVNYIHIRYRPRMSGPPPLNPPAPLFKGKFVDNDLIHDITEFGTLGEINDLIIFLNKNGKIYDYFFDNHGKNKKYLLYIIILLYKNYNILSWGLMLFLNGYDILLLSSCIDEYREEKSIWILQPSDIDYFNNVYCAKISMSSNDPAFRGALTNYSFKNSSDCNAMKSVVEYWPFLVCIADHNVQKTLCNRMCFSFCHPAVKQSIREIKKLRQLQKSGELNLPLPADIQTIILDFV